MHVQSDSRDRVDDLLDEFEDAVDNAAPVHLPPGFRSAFIFEERDCIEKITQVVADELRFPRPVPPRHVESFVRYRGEPDYDYSEDAPLTRLLIMCVAGLDALSAVLPDDTARDIADRIVARLTDYEILTLVPRLKLSAYEYKRPARTLGESIPALRREFAGILRSRLLKASTNTPQARQRRRPVS